MRVHDGKVSSLVANLALYHCTTLTHICFPFLVLWTQFLFRYFWRGWNQALLWGMLIMWQLGLPIMFTTVIVVKLVVIYWKRRRAWFVIVNSTSAKEVNLKGVGKKVSILQCGVEDNKEAEIIQMRFAQSIPVKGYSKQLAFLGRPLVFDFMSAELYINIWLELMTVLTKWKSWASIRSK